MFFFISGLVAALFFNFAWAAQTDSATSSTNSAEAEKKADKIDNLQEKIDDLGDVIDQKRKKERTITEEVKIIDQNVEAMQLEMQKTKNVINDYDLQINQMTSGIEQIEAELARKKKILSEYLRSLDQSSNEIGLALLDSGVQLDDYFQMMDNLEKMQEELRKILDEVTQTKMSLEEKRTEVLDKKGEQSQVYLMQDQQKDTLEYEQGRKERLLAQTQKDISLLDVEREELRKQLNALQSLGTSISLDDAIAAAKYASSKTGVRTAFLLGVLRVESNMGQNVGGGKYKTDMNPAQHENFKNICKELGLKAEEMPVSRRVCYNKSSKDGCGGWGGAMGPAQFMPSTWMGYKDRVAKVTGNKTPNPWNIRDALVAMGLKLAAVDGVSSGKGSAERKAASMYLAGGNWQNYTWYGDRVMYYADGFERYMKD